MTTELIKNLNNLLPIALYFKNSDFVKMLMQQLLSDKTITELKLEKLSYEIALHINFNGGYFSVLQSCGEIISISYKFEPIEAKKLNKEKK